MAFSDNVSLDDLAAGKVVGTVAVGRRAGGNRRLRPDQKERGRARGDEEPKSNFAAIAGRPTLPTAGTTGA